MRKALTIISIILMIGFFLWTFPLSLFGYRNETIETSVSKNISIFIRALGESDTATFFAMVSPGFLMQEVMPNGEVISYWASEKWGDELKKASVEFRNLEATNFSVFLEDSYADVFGKISQVNKANVKGYFWSRLRKTTNEWLVVAFKVEWDSPALEKVYATLGPNFTEEMANIQKWAGITFGEDRNNVLKKLGRPEKEVKGYQYAHYESKGVTIGYVTTWDLWVERLSIQSQSYKTIRGVGVGDSEAFMKERYGLGYEITTWGASKRRTYSYDDFANSKAMQFEVVNSKIIEISFIDRTQEQKIQR